MSAELVLSKPLRALGGRVSSSHSLTLFMHEGYDRPFLKIDTFWRRLDEFPTDELILAYGSLDNPAFSWPHYILKKDLP